MILQMRLTPLEKLSCGHAQLKQYADLRHKDIQKLWTSHYYTRYTAMKSTLWHAVCAKQQERMDDKGKPRTPHPLKKNEKN